VQRRTNSAIAHAQVRNENALSHLTGTGTSTSTPQRLVPRRQRINISFVGSGMTDNDSLYDSADWPASTILPILFNITTNHRQVSQTSLEVSCSKSLCWSTGSVRSTVWILLKNIIQVDLSRERRDLNYSTIQYLLNSRLLLLS
jgi:hypothetical protein